MASKGYVVQLLNRLPEDIRAAVQQAFDYTLDSLRLGDNDRAENFQWFRVTGTTHATANTEFSLLHGMDGAPSKFIPIIDLNEAGSELVPLRVSRTPDAKRVYFTSTSTGVSFTGYCE